MGQVTDNMKWLQLVWGHFHVCCFAVDCPQVNEHILKTSCELVQNQTIALAYANLYERIVDR
jgi:glycosyltransferase A (GT-A) superfamily protein (DUF2064 family)